MEDLVGGLAVLVLTSKPYLLLPVHILAMISSRELPSAWMIAPKYLKELTSKSCSHSCGSLLSHRGNGLPLSRSPSCSIPCYMPALCFGLLLLSPSSFSVPPLTHAGTHARRHARTHARTHAGTHTRTHVHACMHTLTHERTHARTNARTHTMHAK